MGDGGGGRSGGWTAAAVLAVQLPLVIRVVGRLVRTAQGARIPEFPATVGGVGLSVLVPVLDEQDRLGPCLLGLVEQGPEVVEILVVDGGSTDGTGALAARFAERDGRVRLIDASPVPAGWNGKAHGLQVGFERTRPETEWLLTIDADVRPGPTLARSLVAFARREGVAALSAATRQEISGAAEAALHPALLTTLVYRFGIPGRATARVDAVQANGQCFLLRRDALTAVGGFGPTRDSVCEDVTLARTLASAGHRVGFYETDGLVSVAMYAGWRDAWTNWTRSLPMRDRYSGRAGWVGLAEVALVQAAPLPLVVAVALWLGVGANRGRRSARSTPRTAGRESQTHRMGRAGQPAASGVNHPGPPRRSPLKEDRGRAPIRASRSRAFPQPVIPSVSRNPSLLADGFLATLGMTDEGRASGRRGRLRTRPRRPSGGWRWGGSGLKTPSRGRHAPPGGRRPSPSRAVTLLLRVNALLVLVRIGVLVGTARAYARKPWGYWLSPLCDVPAAVGVSLKAVRRRHEWRGRPIVRGGPR